jgi:F-type H+-transporting ATPase subunit delta
MSTDDRLRAYAKAFYEAALERWLDQLNSAAGQLTQNPALLNRVQASSEPVNKRQSMLDGLMPAGVDPPVRNFLYTLMERGDLGALSEIIDALRHRMALGAEEPVPVEITTAVELSEAERQALVAKLTNQFGDNLAIQYHKNPAILGGMIIRAGDKLIDGSVSTRLQEMRQALGVATRE